MKIIKSTVLGLCLLTGIHSQNANATLSFGAFGVYGSATYTFANLSVLPLGVGLYTLSNDYGRCKWVLCVDKALGLASLGVGLFFLDEESGSMSFAELNDENAIKLGLSVEQKDAFNNSLEEINILKDEMTAALMEMEKPTLTDADHMWEQNKDLIDHDAFIAIKTIRNSFRKK